MNAESSIDRLREIVEDPSSLARHANWLRQCLEEYLSPAGEGKNIGACLGITARWRFKERQDRRNEAIRELIKFIDVEQGSVASQINEKINTYLRGDYRHDYVHGLPGNAGRQRQLLYEVIINGGNLCQRRIEQLVTKFT